MSLFSAFQSLWSPCGDASATPMVNIDGTPILNSTVDIHGHPYGVTEVMDAGLHNGGISDWDMTPELLGTWSDLE